jgi:hypothetical protein
MGWLGRQVGHIRCAIRHNPADVKNEVIWRDRRVDQIPHPANPELTLRRTTVDEIIVQEKRPST